MLGKMAESLVHEFWSNPPDPGDLETFRLGSGRHGVLLLHGFCGTPPEMRGLGEHLAGRGFRVHGALLAGHGTSPEDLDRYSWRDWVASAEQELEDLRAECETVSVAGQSMGGTLSLLLAARHADVAAVATMAAVVRLPSTTVAAIRVGAYLRRWHEPRVDRVDLWEPERVRLLRSYTRRSLRAHTHLLSLMAAARSELGSIKCPALVMHGRRDGTVGAGNAEIIASGIGPSARTHYFERSGHALTVDVDREEVYTLVEQHIRAAIARPAAVGA
jgi:carboxylesterase